MTESGKVARNSDGQLGFVQSVSPGLGCRQFLVGVSHPGSQWPFSVSSCGTETKTTTLLCSVLFV